MKYAYFSILIVSCLSFLSCKDDTEAMDYEVSPVVFDSQLRTVLTEMGFRFSEKGELVCDDRVLNTVSLDLSDQNLTSVCGLSSFSSLEEVNLEDNRFTTFDFADLPGSIKSVALRGNDRITSYLHLMANDGVTSLCKNLTNLKLPHSAKWEADVLPSFYKARGKDCLIVMADEAGKYSEYSVNRTIPDIALRNYLYTNFPSVFVSASEIDLTRKLTEKKDLVYETTSSSLEGVEYIFGNPGFSGKVCIAASPDTHYSMTHAKLSLGVSQFSMHNIDTPAGIDFTSASSLKVLRLANNAALDSLTLPAILLQKEVTATSIFDSEVYVAGCASLKKIVLMPGEGGMIGKLHFTGLPSLDCLDFSCVKAVNTLVLDEVNPNIGTLNFPTELTEYIDGLGHFSPGRQLALSISHPKAAAFVQACKAMAEVVDVSYFYN